MIKRLQSLKKPDDMGLAVRRFFVFALPAFAFLGFVVVFVAMGALKETPEEKEDIIKATPVVVAQAEAEPVRLTITTQGEATPRTAIDLAPQISGKVVYVSPSFLEGGAFEKGDVLIRIEPAEYEFRVIQARSNVAQARSRFASEEAEAQIAQKEWEEIGDGEGTELALRKPQLAEAAALLASAEAALREAELQLARTSIRAPFKGRVDAKMIDIGQYVTPGLKMGEIFSTDTMEIALPLTDSELGQLGLQVGFQQTTENLGPEVKLSALVAGAPRQWVGRITRTDSGYDRETRVLFAYAEVKDPYGAGADNGAPLAAGLFVGAEIEGREYDNSVVVPRTALRGNDQVFVARADNTLEIRTVAVAQTDRIRAVLIGGLEEGENVVTSPVRGAADGMIIAIAGGVADNGSATSVADASNVGGSQ